VGLGGSRSREELDEENELQYLIPQTFLSEKWVMVGRKSELDFQLPPAIRGGKILSC
jgi:hypothetical protein